MRRARGVRFAPPWSRRVAGPAILCRLGGSVRLANGISACQRRFVTHGGALGIRQRADREAELAASIGGDLRLELHIEGHLGPKASRDHGRDLRVRAGTELRSWNDSHPQMIEAVLDELP